MKTKSIIIHLIKEELRNKHLMYALEELGFDCSFYTIQVSDVILMLSGLKTNIDEIEEWYFELIHEAIQNVTFYHLNEKLDKWSHYIYTKLLERTLKEEVS